MVRLVSALSLAALISCTTAAPSTGSQRIEARDEGFSFEEWANGIVAYPEGDHLSPEAAIQAAQEFGIRKRDDLTKRDAVSCNDKGQLKASLADAVSCINQLAARGNANCHIPYAGGAALSTIGLAQIYGVTVNKAGSILPCQAFAASAGRILDICVHPGDTTVQGSNHPNSNIQIHLGRP
ncbi:hypothetical protein B0T10DRAFT_562845 [Thelonectria olida]|uniref:Uncharacterized protein n=1 Tax=Thelonectria olida TaxID=1576542 RepID=A0A9P9AKQ7_9HYPO|nr:hypothetical protein B0T10DRAFT_562845 [Thelonectria olida]